MTDKIKHFWNIFKKKPDTWFFYLFLLTSTLSIRKVLYYFPIDNSLNEYTGVYIYLSDIFLILTFISFILCNNNSVLSIIRAFVKDIEQLFLSVLKKFHVEHSVFRQEKALKNILINVPRGTLMQIMKTYTQVVNNYLIIFPLFAVFFSFVSILWTTNSYITLFRSVKFLEYVLLYFYIITIVPRGTMQTFGVQSLVIFSRMFHVEQLQITQTKNLEPELSQNINQINCSTWNNIGRSDTVPCGTILEKMALIGILVGIIHSFVGISQFIMQQSIGLFWLKESQISPQIAGVAKIIFHGEPYIRAYGLFPHPNILGGYLVFSIMLTMLYLKLFHVEQFNNKDKGNYEIQNNCSTWNNLSGYVCGFVPRGTNLLQATVLIQGVALMLTFSKSAIFGLLIGLFYVSYQTNSGRVACLVQYNVPRGTLSRWFGGLFVEMKTLSQLFHVEQVAKKMLFVMCLVALFFVIAKPDINALFFKSLSERSFYLNVSRGTILLHPFLGIGSGQFVPNMVANYALPAWQYQPVHNVFLLIASEYGLIVLIAFMFYLFILFKNTYCSTWNNKYMSTCAKNKPIIAVYLKGILLAFIFIMLFDHYFWDIQQGQFLLWILLALIASQNKKG